MRAPSRAKTAIGLSGLAITLTLAIASQQDAQAAGASALIEWDAPEGCAGALEVHSRLGTVLGHEPDTLGKLSRVRGTVLRTPRGYRLVLEAFEHDRRSSRVFEAVRCDDLVDAGVIALALAIDPESASRLEGSSSTPLGLVADGNSGEPPAPSSAGASTSPATGPEQTSAQGGGDASVRPRGFATAGAVVEYGALPRLTPGFAIDAGVALGAVSLGAYGALLASETLQVAPDQSVEMDLLFAGLRACHALRDAAPELRACVCFEAGRMRALGLDLDQAREARDLWLAAGAAFDARWPLSPALALQLRVEPMLPLNRKEYTVNGNDAIHTPAVLSARVYFGLSFSPE